MKSNFNLKLFGALYKCSNYSEKRCWPKKGCPWLLKVGQKKKKDDIQGQGNSRNEAMEWAQLKVEEAGWEVDDN